MKYESFNDQTLATVLTKLFQAEVKLPVARKLLQLQKQLADEAAFRYMEGSHPLSQDAARMD